MKVTQTWALLRWHHILQLAKISVITSKSQINHQHAIEQVIQIGTKKFGQKARVLLSALSEVGTIQHI